MGETPENIRESCTWKDDALASREISGKYAKKIILDTII